MRHETYDPQRLQKLGLPLWRDQGDFGDALDLDFNELSRFTRLKRQAAHPHYVSFEIAKRNGKSRTIHAPKRRLKGLQRRLNELLVSRLAVSEHAHGYVTGRSVKTNAEPHVNRSFVVKFDLRDCFETITFTRVRGLLVSCGYSHSVAVGLANILTEARRQPVEIDGGIEHIPVGPRFCVQGAPTSPGLCNAILYRLDQRLAGMSQSLGFNFTRYADDLTFSGDHGDKVAHLMSIVPSIVHSEGFQTNGEKTRVLRQSNRQTVTGVTVNQSLGLSRQERRRLRAEIHAYTLRGDRDPRKLQKISGRLAYLAMLNPAQAEALYRQLESH